MELRAFLALLSCATACSASSALATEPNCPFTEDDLIGAWWSPMESDEIVENDGREVAFDRAGEDREFKEWLHHRPFDEGTWVFKDCKVTVTYDPSGTEEFWLVGKETSILVDSIDDPQNRAEYTRIVEANEPDP